MKLVNCILFVIVIFGAQSIKAKSTITPSYTTSNNIADTTKYGYNKRIQQMAVLDARHFKLSPDQRKDLKQGLLSKNSDYFKPTAQYCSDPQMITDSNYVREFREAAYRRAGHKSSSRVIFVGLGVVVLAVALSLGAYEIFGSK